MQRRTDLETSVQDEGYLVDHYEFENKKAKQKHAEMLVVRNLFQ